MTSLSPPLEEAAPWAGAPGALLVRQPLLSTSRHLRGHRLALRPAGPGVGDDVLSDALDEALGVLGPRLLARSGPPLLTLPRPHLTGARTLPFRPGDVVVEPLPGTPLDDEVLAGLRALAATGSAVLLDDQGPDVPVPAAARWARLDLDHLGDGEDLATAVDRLHDDGRQVLVVGVASRDQLATCAALGVPLVAGPALSVPEHPEDAGAAAPARLAALRLLAALSEPDVHVSRVEALLRTDPSLMLRVLRAANAAVGAVQPISSLRQALVMIGLSRLRSWLVVMVLTGARAAAEDRLGAALARARACELVAASSKEQAFLVGVLSGLSDALGPGASELIEHLELAPNVRAALAEGEGPLGAVLRAVTGYEAWQVPDVPPGTTTGEVARAWLTATAWALEALETASAAA